MLFSQLSSEEDVKKAKFELGLATGDKGIEAFVPTYFGPYLPPATQNESFWFLRFSNGFETNVGLIETLKFLRPGTWLANWMLEYMAYDRAHKE